MTRVSRLSSWESVFSPFKSLSDLWKRCENLMCYILYYGSKSKTQKHFIRCKWSHFHEWFSPSTHFCIFDGWIWKEDIYFFIQGKISVWRSEIYCTLLFLRLLFLQPRSSCYVSQRIMMIKLYLNTFLKLMLYLICESVPAGNGFLLSHSSLAFSLLTYYYC